MFDGRSDAIVPDAVIVVEGTVIKAAGSRLAVPPGTQVIDLGNVTLLPGFIDAHTHVTFVMKEGNVYRNDGANGAGTEAPRAVK
jgi:imidazolonepropionase-like amidohydrolase